MKFEISGRTVLVTGASRGIGLKLVEGLLARGAKHIVAVASHEKSLVDLKDKFGPCLTPFAVNLSKKPEIETFTKTVTRQFPDISLLVNNAAIQHNHVVTSADKAGAKLIAEDFANELDINLRAPILLSTLFLPHLKNQTDAAIVNVTSGLVLVPKMSAPVYCATKNALSTFTRCLGDQTGKYAPQVRIIEALPAIVDTDMTAGRGRNKISAEQCAKQILDGLQNGQTVIDVGKTRFLRLIMRIAPGLGYRIMRNG